MKLRLKPKFVIIISLIIGMVMIASAYFELKQSRDEIFHLLSQQAKSLSEVVTRSSVNTFNSSFEIENLITERLLNNAKMVRRLDSLSALNVNTLIKIGKENDIFRINLFDKAGNRILSNRIPEQGHDHPEGMVNRHKELEPILTSKTDELIIGLKEASFSDELRYAIAISRAHNRGAIVLNLNAEDFLEFRKKIGIGKIVQDISDNEGIEYIVLQDSLGILAASNSVKEISSISTDVFLLKTILMDSTLTRVIDFNDTEVYEVVKSLTLDGEFIGIYRIGLTLDEVRNLETRMIRRAIIISIILAAISIIVLSIIFTNQNLKSVSNEFNQFKYFTDSILKNMNEAVIIISKDSTIKMFNNWAKEVFEMKRDDIIGKKLSKLKDCNISFLLEFISDKTGFRNIDRSIQIEGKEKHIKINITPNYNLNRELESHTIVITDVTENKNLEEQAKRNEKLLAMGELASGVAHEIRNPINSIGMIAQRLNKEFKPKESEDEYTSITNLLKTEVSRINKIITQFLQYAKPLGLQKTRVDVNKFINEIYQLYKDQAEQKNISFTVSTEENLFANFDPELIKQTMMNIIQNAIDAVDNKGRVSVTSLKKDDKLVISIIDNGEGIKPKEQKKIFNLYYTTKQEGNGLGLSISQKIVSQHNGLIELASNKNSTIFKIILPVG
ncbi:MAG: PAS domain-containing protein [Ignavibacteria bacterium]|nr:PAS domain-containing protein [Ignavibacteria bacterium]MBT8382306.1 PAS domain-containing protein [Ignavibacteria bacterium]MBT8391934.1 PAS domain-containing protein [Ignavibacteria bacterium]NNJ52203.1 PAS domain-containing protein [Ignavibacteriaceae bacterium]NNL21754.1 PAS domain-containing protein [Ignavibacteriaceae bacterium]